MKRNCLVCLALPSPLLSMVVIINYLIIIIFFFIGFLKAYFLVVSKSLFEQDSDERAINILFMALLLHA